MIWNNAATWDNTLIWKNTDDLSAITESSETVAPVKGKVNTVGLIQSLVPVSMASSVAITGDVELAGLLPDRAFIDKIIVVETSGNTGQISAGTTSGGFELFTSSAIIGSDATCINVGKLITTAGSIFLHADGAGDSWSSMNVDVYLLYWKL